MVKLVFYGTERSKTNETELTAYLNTKNEIFVSIDREDYPPHYICLDKPTAIKFHRELKKQISFFEEGDENGNG
jgi:hypothetical protein